MEGFECVATRDALDAMEPCVPAGAVLSYYVYAAVADHFSLDGAWVDAGASGSYAGGAWAERRWDAPEVVAALKADPKAYLAAGAPGLLGHDAAPETVKCALDMAYQADPGALEKCLRAFTETDFRSDLRAVRVPTLVVYGSGDMPSMPGNACRTAAAIAGSRVEAYEGAPHGLFITDRERFNDDLLRFIRS